MPPAGILGLVPARPVLDAFAHDEEVALDQALDDLTIPLLPRTELAGHGHRLAKRAGGRGGERVKC